MGEEIKNDIINYEELFKELVEGFALHEIICNDDGMPVDYRYLSVNPAFEKMVGFKTPFGHSKYRIDENESFDEIIKDVSDKNLW